MKKYFILAAMAAMTLSFASCTKEDKKTVEDEGITKTARIKTLTNGDVFEYSYDANGRVSSVAASWDGEVYATYVFNYNGSNLEIKDGEKTFLSAVLNADGLATSIEYDGKSFAYTYKDGFLVKATKNGEVCSEQSIDDYCVEYWTRLGDSGMRYKNHTYTTKLNVGGLHTEWCEDAGMKRWVYETGLLGNASKYAVATAQWGDRTGLAEYDFEYDKATGAITYEGKRYGEPDVVATAEPEKVYATWEAIK